MARLLAFFILKTQKNCRVVSRMVFERLALRFAHCKWLNSQLWLSKTKVCENVTDSYQAPELPKWLNGFYIPFSTATPDCRPGVFQMQVSTHIHADPLLICSGSRLKTLMLAISGFSCSN